MSHIYEENCCCSPTGNTGIQGGIHPDHIQTAFVDAVPGADASAWLTASGILSLYPIHIVGGSISYYAKFPASGNMIPGAYATANESDIYNALPLNVTLFTAGYEHDMKDQGGFIMPNEAASAARVDARTPIFAGCLTPAQPYISLPSNLWGYFCDGGLFWEVQSAAGRLVGTRICIQYVDRANFTPAYSDPLINARAQWECVNGQTDFLDGFYGGVASLPGDITDETTPDETNPDATEDYDEPSYTTVGEVPSVAINWTIPN